MLPLLHSKCWFYIGSTEYILFLEKNECDSNPCVNNGICQDEIGSYLCDCSRAWTGINCEIGTSYNMTCLWMFVYKEKNASNNRIVYIDMYINYNMLIIKSKFVSASHI